MLAAPLENHWINITDSIVESISVKPVYESRYLGEQSVLLPATINAHAHLELSQLEAPLDVPSRSMSDWVAALLTFRRSAVYDAEQGIRQAFCRPELVESTAVVADVVPTVIKTAAEGTCLWLPFTELIGWQSNHEREVQASRFPFGLSPHAPQTVYPALLEWAINQNVPIAMHLAETLEELQLLRHHTGPLLDMMRRADPDYDPKSVLLGKRPMDYLQLLSTAPKAFVIHGNYLDDEEMRFLAAHRETMSVVYCPRSHAYFQHSAYPLQKMLDCGVRVLLGTDSLASVPDLNLVEEIRFVLKHHPTVPAESVYRMGTVEGASVFDLLREGFGTVQPGSPVRSSVLDVKQPI